MKNINISVNDGYQFIISSWLRDDQFYNVPCRPKHDQKKKSRKRQIVTQTKKNTKKNPADQIPCIT